MGTKQPPTHHLSDPEVMEILENVQREGTGTGARYWREGKKVSVRSELMALGVTKSIAGLLVEEAITEGIVTAKEPEVEHRKIRFCITETSNRSGTYYQIFDHHEGRTIQFASYDRKEAREELARLNRGPERMPIPKGLV